MNKQMKFKNYITEARKPTPKWWVQSYMDNMFDNGDVENKEFGKYRYKDWKDFFESAKKGAYDWSEDLYTNWKYYGFSSDDNWEIDKYRDKILKVSPGGFSKYKKIFLLRRKDDEADSTPEHPR
jgi:hypothetical protein